MIFSRVLPPPGNRYAARSERNAKNGSSEFIGESRCEVRATHFQGDKTMKLGRGRGPFPLVRSLLVKWSCRDPRSVNQARKLASLKKKKNESIPVAVRTAS